MCERPSTLESDLGFTPGFGPYSLPGPVGDAYPASSPQLCSQPGATETCFTGCGEE